MFMTSALANVDQFKRPHREIMKKNTRIEGEPALDKAYTLPDPSEKEIIARRLVEQSFRSSEKSSRRSTPRTPRSSRISSIFPIFNYQLPVKRNRN